MQLIVEIIIIIIIIAAATSSSRTEATVLAGAVVGQIIHPAD
jgi:hypothetical protein